MLDERDIKRFKGQALSILKSSSLPKTINKFHAKLGGIGSHNNSVITNTSSIVSNATSNVSTNISDYNQQKDQILKASVLEENSHSLTLNNDLHHGYQAVPDLLRSPVRSDSARSKQLGKVRSMSNLSNNQSTANSSIGVNNSFISAFSGGSGEIVHRPVSRHHHTDDNILSMYKINNSSTQSQDISDSQKINPHHVESNSNSLIDNGSSTTRVQTMESVLEVSNTVVPTKYVKDAIIQRMRFHDNFKRSSSDVMRNTIEKNNHEENLQEVDQNYQTSNDNNSVMNDSLRSEVNNHNITNSRRHPPQHLNDLPALKTQRTVTDTTTTTSRSYSQTSEQSIEETRRRLKSLTHKSKVASLASIQEDYAFKWLRMKERRDARRIRLEERDRKVESMHSFHVAINDIARFEYNCIMMYPFIMFINVT